MVDICKDNKNLIKIIFKKILFPSLILGIFLIMYNFYKTYIHFYMAKRRHLGMNEYFIIVNVILIGIILSKTVEGFLSWYKDRIKSKIISSFDKEFIPFIQNTFNLLIWFFVFLGILSVLRIHLNYLINILTIIFLTAVLLFKDNILNVVAGCMIVIDKPFVIGDKIEIFPGEIVEVLEIGVRRSKFLSKKKYILNMPNMSLNKIKIVNYSLSKSC